MNLYHHYHAIRQHRIINSDFHLFELSVWIHVFGRALISVFIPIFLLQLGYSTGNIMTYYFLYCLFDLPLNFVARWSTRRLGARLTIAVSTAATILFLFILLGMSTNHWPLLIALALSAAVYDALYWVAHIFLFMESSKKRGRMSRDTSSLSIIRQFGGLLAPAFGAVVLIFLHQQMLIILSVAILAASVVPLFMAKNLPDKPSTPQRSLKQFFSRKADLREYVIMSLYGVDGAVEDIIWPIFIFSLFASIQSVAIIPLTASVTTIIFTYFAGRISEHYRLKAMTIGGLMIAFIWISRLLIEVPLYYYGSVFLTGLFAVLILIPMDSTIYERAEKTDALSASMYRNFFNMVSQTLLFGVLALLTNVFQISFLLAATSALLIAVIAMFVGGANQTSRSRKAVV
ncbi:TPA: hypothetical protein DEB00_01190 [Candidatus Uhrbacteria bacterium]|nr:hypothetical protein [Candidatus Uhrbacteria bacterium]